MTLTTLITAKIALVTLTKKVTAVMVNMIRKIITIAIAEKNQCNSGKDTATQVTIKTKSNFKLEVLCTIK